VQREVEAEVIFNRRKRAHEEVAAQFMQQAALDNKDEFIDFCVEKIYRAGK